MNVSDRFDYIIVGAGSAGCVLADGLSAHGCSVLVLEAGGSDRLPWIKLPIGYGRTFFNEKINWKYQTEPDAGIANRSDYWPRGKVIGGSSSINALVYFRGLPHDFDDWSSAGAKGWDWANVRHHFEAIERRVDAEGNIQGGGPLTVTDVSAGTHACNRHFFSAAEALGYRCTEDFNGSSGEGVGHYQITTRRGLRQSAADAFLRPALRRTNVKLVTRAHVKRLLLEGKTVTGVEYEDRHGNCQQVHAGREVVLSAGAIGSPQLLQLSGIGPESVLRNCNITPVHVNEAVGRNLQDHLGVSYFYKATEPTLNNELAGWKGKLRVGAQYLLNRSGPLSMSVNQCGGFVRSSASLERPDQQLYFNPVTYTTSPAGKRPLINPDKFAGFIISFQPCRPMSRGEVRVRSADFREAPAIFPGYLQTSSDIESVRAGGRLMRDFLKTDALRGLIREPIEPNIECLDDEATVEDFRQRAGSVFHPVATCRMGDDPDQAVVDTSLRVFGISRLRVVDASAFPNITSGNTNAPTMMLAHKAVEHILQERN